MKKHSLSIALTLGMIAQPTLAAQVATEADFFAQDGTITTAENYAVYESAR